MRIGIKRWGAKLEEGVDLLRRPRWLTRRMNHEPWVAYWSWKRVPRLVSCGDRKWNVVYGLFMMVASLTNDASVLSMHMRRTK